ncbi:uncharacterized protein LOC113212235 isoform X1 [Frankliniella occidentalis]|uniref:Uncharacterized protein LOC113212235 isoform X1 n=1 Tax=Frankliniella occidentalis TaxID=133901 RepID=A0A9C6XTA8_FRAOC|nr:uncharacterized protein LOC113212235 isoform X1 [Frankliniella occidentalis]
MVASFNRFNNASAGDGTSMFLGQLGEAIPFIDISLNGGALGAFTTIEPHVMRNALLWTHEKYNISIVITENGYGDMLGLGVHDNQRGAYHSAFLRTLVSTVNQYNVSVLAYSAWSLIDSFEFKGGYSRPFGLIHIDYASGTLDRSHKDSSSFWIKMRETNSVPFVEPDKATTLSPPTTALRTSTKAPSTAAPSSSTCTSSSMTVILLGVLGLMRALSRSPM